MKKSYTCNNCGVEQVSVYQDQEAIIRHEYDMQKGEWTGEMESIDYQDSLGWVCPGCDEDLSDDIVKSITDEIYG